MLQEFIDKNFFRLFVFTLIFGVIFYDTIGFDYTDELCAMLLFSLFLKYVFSTSRWEFNKMFLVVTTVFLFYLFYSFLINSNVKIGIITDFIVQYKPYLALFCVYAMKPTITPANKSLICEICIVIGFYLAIVGFFYMFSHETIYYTLKHPSRLATAASIVGLLYLYCSTYTWKDKLIFVLLMAIAICSGRSKAYGFFIICTIMVFVMKPTFSLKFNLKNIFFFSVTIALMLFFTYEKIDLYFISGGDFLEEGQQIQNSIARAALYFNSFEILKDYFPFGSGFASYATYPSGVYYSNIYAEYGLDGIWGLTKQDYSFIADTYYPALAEFGVVGVCLFFVFWIYLGLKALKSYRIAYKESLMILMIVCFFLIECVADTTITHNRGFYMMMLLGILFSDIWKVKQKKTVSYGENNCSK